MKKIGVLILALMLAPVAASAQVMMSKAAQHGNSEKLPELQQRLQQIVDMIAAKRAESAASSSAWNMSGDDDQLKGLDNAIAQIRAKLGMMMNASSTPPGLVNAMAQLQCVQLNRMLRHGSRGDDVKELQRSLIARGHLEEGNDTGFFGMLTRKAVQKLQEEQGIASSGDENSNGFGAVGPRTRGILSRCEQ